MITRELLKTLAWIYFLGIPMALVLITALSACFKSKAPAWLKIFLK